MRIDTRDGKGYAFGFGLALMAIAATLVGCSGLDKKVQANDVQTEKQVSSRQLDTDYPTSQPCESRLPSTKEDCADANTDAQTSESEPVKKNKGLIHFLLHGLDDLEINISFPSNAELSEALLQSSFGIGKTSSPSDEKNGAGLTNG